MLGYSLHLSKCCFRPASAHRFLSGLRDTGVWMKDVSGQDASIAVMGPNLKWQIVEMGKACVQRDTKPSQFQIRVCSLVDTLPGSDREYTDIFSENTELEANSLVVSNEIALIIHPPPDCSDEEDNFDEEFHVDLIDRLEKVVRLIGLYDDPTEETLDEDGRRFLSFLQEHYEVNKNEYLPTLLQFTDGHDEEWIHKSASRLREQGWKLHWDVEYCTAGDLLEGNHLDDEVWVHKDTLEYAYANPYLYLPCFLW